MNNPDQNNLGGTGAVTARANDRTTDMLHVVKWHNGEREWSPFSSGEMDRRQNAMRQWMAKNSVDVALFTSYHGICYYSGFLYCYFGRKYGFVLDHDSATTVTAGIDGGQPWRRTHGDNITYSDWRRDNFYTAVKSLLKPGIKRIGIEFDHVSLDFRALPAMHFPALNSSILPSRACGCGRSSPLKSMRLFEREPVSAMWGLVPAWKPYRLVFPSMKSPLLLQMR